MSATKRNANIELLRIISMSMVVMLHALGKSNLLVNVFEKGGANPVIAWVFEALSVGAVNIFILISGYFLIDSKFRLGRVIELVCQVLFYTIGSFAICYLLGVRPEGGITIYFLLKVFLPVQMDVFWFVTAYLVIYMLQPIISAGVKNISQKQFATVIALLLVYESVFKSVLPFKMEGDKAGYDVVWFLTVFLIGAYIKLYGFKYIKKASTGAILYLASTMLVLAERFALDFRVARLGRFKEIHEISFTYNHIFVLLASIGIFAFFVQKKPLRSTASKIICAVSPMSLGVYLFHENISLRYCWQKWLGIYESLDKSVVSFVAGVFASVIIVYVAGTAVDFVRKSIFSLAKKVFVKNET